MATPNKLKPFTNDILSKFDSGATVKELAEVYNVADRSICGFLKNNDRELPGIPVKQCRNLMATDAAYVAGLIDGEGCLSAVRGTTRGSQVVNYGLQLSLSQREVIKWLQQVTGLGSIHLDIHRNEPRWKPLSRWHISGQGLSTLLVQIKPYLKVKHKQADLLIELSQLKRESLAGRGRNKERQWEILRQIQLLNKRGIDVPLEELECLD